MKQFKIKTRSAKERERCVVCGCRTRYTKDVPIDKRSCYIEGGGQLCERCCREIYSVYDNG